MNIYRISIANSTIVTSATNDFVALRNSGLFGEITQINYAVTTDGKDLWVYKVSLNGKIELATVERA